MLCHCMFYVQTFFITQKLLGGHAETFVISPLLKIIKFHATFIFERQYWINVENFLMKYKAIIGIHYFDITVWFQYTHFWTRENR